MTARAERDERREELARTPISLELWFGILGGPASGFFLVLINYPLVSRACVNNSSIYLHLIQLLFLGVALLSGFTSWRIRGRLADWPDAAGGMLPRVRFMTTVGILTSAMAVVEILFTWIPIFFIGACHGT